MNEQVEAVLRTLPRKIKVGAYDWRVKITSGDNDAHGMTHWAERVVELWPDTIPTPQLLVGTVLHEFLHTIYEDAWAVSKDPEEETVTGFEFGLVSLFRDNPKLLTWIKRGLK